MAEVGDFRGALDELDLYAHFIRVCKTVFMQKHRYLSAFPYQNNAELHCYAGLMSLYLSQSETRRSTQRKQESAFLALADMFFLK